MAGVKVRFVDHIEALWRERSFELLSYPFRNGSRVSIHLASLLVRLRAIMRGTLRNMMSGLRASSYRP
jgi:hypothetical protein